jgi:hypothetical protein
LSVPEAVKKYERWAMVAVGAVEFPLAFVAGYSLVGGISTGDAQIDTPLRLAPFGFALGIALICCVATICAGRVLGAYAEQQRIERIAELVRAESDQTGIDETNTNTEMDEEQAA